MKLYNVNVSCKKEILSSFLLAHMLSSLNIWNRIREYIYKEQNDITMLFELYNTIVFLQILCRTTTISAAQGSKRLFADIILFPNALVLNDHDKGTRGHESRPTRVFSNIHILIQPTKRSRTCIKHAGSTLFISNFL